MTIVTCLCTQKRKAEVTWVDGWMRPNENSGIVEKTDCDDGDETSMAILWCSKMTRQAMGNKIRKMLCVLLTQRTKGYGIYVAY